MKWAVPFGLILFGVLSLLPTDPVTPVPPDDDEQGPVEPTGDPLGLSYTADRAKKVELLKELDERYDEFTGDAEISDWWRERIEDSRPQVWDPFLEAMGTALVKRRGLPDADVPADPDALKRLIERLER